MRERHQRLALEADELRRLSAEGEATSEDCERAERAERDAYLAWRLTRTARLGRHTITPDEEVEEVPHDL